MAQLAEYTTQLNLAKQTLALAANGQEEYNKLLKTARSISQDYAISLKETIGGFSQVAVAARANNLTLKETETISTRYRRNRSSHCSGSVQRQAERRRIARANW